MTTECVVGSSSPVTLAIRAAKAEAQDAGKCDGRCRTCLPDQLHECMARRRAMYREAEPTLADQSRDAQGARGAS